MPNKFSVIILAAGKGKRMNNPDLPKVLSPLYDKPLLEHVIDSIKELNPDKKVVVVGYQKQKVKDFLNTKYYSEYVLVDQDDQLGTGHAVDQARNEFVNYDGSILILAGDVPLIRYSTLKKLIDEHFSSDSVISVLTANAPDPTGYGRIIKNNNGMFIKIVEHKDADKSELSINEINSGIIIAKSSILFNALSSVSNQNAQGEYYLTDTIHIVSKMNHKVSAFNFADFDELQGVNSPEQLENVKSNYTKIKGI